MKNSKSILIMTDEELSKMTNEELLIAVKGMREGASTRDLIRALTQSEEMTVTELKDKLESFGHKVTYDSVIYSLVNSENLPLKRADRTEGDSKKVKVIELIEEGYRNKEIEKELGVHYSYITSIKGEWKKLNPTKVADAEAKRLKREEDARLKEAKAEAKQKEAELKAVVENKKAADKAAKAEKTAE